MNHTLVWPLIALANTSTTNSTMVESTVSPSLRAWGSVGWGGGLVRESHIQKNQVLFWKNEARKCQYIRVMCGCNCSRHEEVFMGNQTQGDEGSRSVFLLVVTNRFTENIMTLHISLFPAHPVNLVPSILLLFTFFQLYIYVFHSVPTSCHRPVREGNDRKYGWVRVR